MTDSKPSPTIPSAMVGLWIAFFLWGGAPGFYLPAISNILAAKGLTESYWVSLAFLAPPVAAMISPLIIGALADNRFAAQKVLAWISIISSVLLGSAFAMLDIGPSPSPWAFLGLFTLSSIVAAPMPTMLVSISMAHLRDGERQFPIVRLGGTLGWMVAGAATSFILHADNSPMAGYAGAITRLLCGLSALFLPHTPPAGNSRSLRTLLGLDAFRLLKERDHLVFFTVTTLISIPLAAFFMHTSPHLKALGNTTPTATMTIGQISEIAAMLLMSVVMTRFRVKTVLAFAVALSALRYVLYAVAGATGSLAWLISGIALHGLCYTLYFITGQLFLDRRVDPAMRGQAQGLLSLASSGVGSFVGTLFSGWLLELTVAQNHGGWTLYWTVQAAFIAACLPILLIFYHGVAASRREKQQQA